MPRTKLDKSRKHEKLLVLIKGTAATQGKQASDLANMMGCSISTVFGRMREPGNFTLAELEGLGRGMHIPIEELRQSITWQS